MSDLMDTWHDIESMTGHNVTLRHELAGGWSASCHINYATADSPDEAMTMLRAMYPATVEEWEEIQRQRREEWHRWLDEQRRTVREPDPDALPSEIEIGLGRGHLGDYLRRIHDGGWTIRIAPGSVTITRHDDPEIRIASGDRGGWDVERALAHAYVAWRKRV